MKKFKLVLKELRKDNDMTQEELAKKLSVAKSTVSMYENGNRFPDKETIEAIADLFNVDIDYLYGRTATTTKYMPDAKFLNNKILYGVSVPILSTVVAGMPVDAYEDVLGYEEITRELAATGEFFCLKIKGTSMSPNIQEGDIVVVRQQPDVDSGDIAVVKINGDEATIKKILKQSEGITLIAFNTAVYEPHFYSNEQIEQLPVSIAGKVVEMKRSF